MIKILASRNQFWVEMDLGVLDLAPPSPKQWERRREWAKGRVLERWGRGLCLLNPH